VQEKAQDNKREPTRTQGQNTNQKEERTQGQNTNQKEERDREPKGAQNQRGQQQDRTEGRAEQGSKASGGTNSVTLTTEQRTKVRQTVLSSGPKVGKVDFSISEGMVIPRSVHVVEVPEVLIDIHPEWRGFRYFVYNDEIIIVEPDTLRIVAIVEV